MCKSVHFLKEFIKNSKGFDACVNKVKIKSAGNGNCLASLIVEEEHINRRGVLDSGFSTTLVDVISSWALLTHKKGSRASVSVDIHMNFMKEAKLGDVIEIDAKTNRCGKTLAHLDVTISNEKNGEMLINGSHTKFLLGS